MFVKTAEHNRVVEENSQLTQRIEELQQLVSTSEESAATLQSQVETLTAERDQLTQQVETLTTQVNESQASVTDLQSQVDTLTAENAQLRDLPGAESTRELSETEASHGANMSELDRINEFCKENAGDINACLQAVEKLEI